MVELFWIYVWTIIAGTLAAAVLALWGSHVSARDQSVQVTCIGQGAMLGVLVGIVLAAQLGGQGVDSIVPTLLGLGFGGGIAALGNWIVKGESPSQSTIFISVFGLLLALNSLTGSLFPGLERHLAQVFFGDLATLTEEHARIFAAGSLFLLVLNLVFWKSLIRRSFDLSTFGQSLTMVKVPVLVAEVFNFVFLCLAVQYLGFLFTLCALFLPTTFANFLSPRSLKEYLSIILLTAFLSVPAGFLISLTFTHLPTVPTVAIAMSVIAVFSGLACRFWNKLYIGGQLQTAGSKQ